MTNKRILVLILAFFGLFLFTGEIAAQVDINHYQEIIFSMIYNLGRIVEDNPASEIVYNTYIVAENAVRNGDVSLGIDPNLDTVINGMYFDIHDSGEISLVFGLRFLDTYIPDGSIHYSVLIHEFRHLHDYLSNREVFLAAGNDEKHSYWYELDALGVKAEFIQNYLDSNNLTGFEEFILDSYMNDNLNSASIIILRESMNYFFYFNFLETSYLNNEIPETEVIGELLSNGNILVEYFSNADDDYLSFFHYIEILTFRKYLTRLMIILMDNPLMTWGEVFNMHPDIGRLYYEMSDILSACHAGQMEYLSSLIQFWENGVSSFNSY